MAMINCPKCGFFQPEDQFCASCGINMQKWTAPKVPLWKKLGGNWMVQLSVLFVIIVAVILSDSLSEKNESRLAVEAPRIRRKSSPPPEKREQLEPAESKANRYEKLGTQKVKKLNAKAQPLGTMEEAKALQAEVVFDKSILFEALFIPKNNIASILNSSNQVTDNAGSLHRKSLSNYRKKKRGWTSLAVGSVDYKLNEPAAIFIGETNPESGRNTGFFIQVTVFDASAETANFEVKVWSELKGPEDPGEVFTFETNMKRKHTLVISQFAPKLNYNESEASFIEGTRSLRPLNSARFIEDFNDIVLTLEIGRVR